MIITKDDREIELMTEAGRIVALVHEKLKEVIVPGDRKSTRLNSSHSH